MSVAVCKQTRLDAWLDWQLTRHPTTIELGLDRVAAVADRLRLRPFPAQTITVAGTNGKGSTAAFSERLLTAAGQRVGVFSSPHLWRYNERFRIDGRLPDDSDICAAFETIESARGDTRLTYFEYSTLAALLLFRDANVDVAILEVGLGGRLDAVNIIDADIAVITSIALDHCQWLGDTREQIGYEKAGVLRAAQTAIGCDRDMPSSVIETATRLGTSLALIGYDFDLVARGGALAWTIDGNTVCFDSAPGIVHNNLAGAAMATRALGIQPTAKTLADVAQNPSTVPGRCEFIDEPISIVYDVAHNTAAFDVLIGQLQARSVTGATHVVLAMLADKPIEAAVGRLRAVADHWYPAGLDTISNRGAPAKTIASAVGIDADRSWSSPREAFRAAQRCAKPGDRIVVCGSFHTVADTRIENA